MQFKRGRELKRTRVEIIPMIDTVFFLLVFFMLSSLSLTHLNGLRVDLPTGKNAPSQPRASLTLSVQKSGTMSLNNRVVTLQNLSQNLKRIPNVKSQTLTINADKNVSYGIVMRAIDTARQVGISHTNFVVEPQ